MKKKYWLNKFKSRAGPLSIAVSAFWRGALTRRMLPARPSNFPDYVQDGEFQKGGAMGGCR